MKADLRRANNRSLCTVRKLNVKLSHTGGEKNGMFDFNSVLQSLVVTEDSEASLAAILQHTIVSSMEQIQQHFDSILSKKGTKILIWNLRRAKDGKSEIDFETDESDFRLPEIQIDQVKPGPRNSGSFNAEKSIPDMHYSLRAYLSILYLKPRMQIILRGRKIQAKLVSKRLNHIEHDVYNPHFSREKVKVTFGLDPKNKQQYGIMMYHKNRLIKAYQKIGCQLKTSGQRAGMGVIGVIECNFLKPAHNKQDFEYTKEYRLTLGALGQKLNDYWKEVTEKKAREREFWAVDADDTDEGPTWLQCEDCLKWRNVPRGVYKVTPESWNCSQNPNPRLRSCSLPEEAEDSEELLTPSYQKHHRKLEQQKIRKQEKPLEKSSSEPVQPVDQSQVAVEPTAKQFDSEENTPENDETKTECFPENDTEVDADVQTNDNAQTQQTSVVTQTQQTVTGGDTSGFAPGPTDRETRVQSLKEEQHCTDIDVKRQDAYGDGLSSSKRKSSTSFYCAIKKRHLLGKRYLDAHNDAQNPQPRTETRTFQTSASDPGPTGCSSRAENPDTANRGPSGHTWAQSPSSTAAPPSRTEGPQPGPEGRDREAKAQRLAALEREVLNLRRQLGMEITKTSRGTMTDADCRPALEQCHMGCQTNAAPSSSLTSPAPAAGPAGSVVLGQRVMFDLKEQPGPNRMRREISGSQSKSRVNESEADRGSQSAQKKLQDIRNNVVALLTALLPHLDLSGISMETTDVDNILQQIIEVNSLKIKQL
uniref:CW-type domain-containing protein n=1 Tax=Salarias fasciatus TaxID=181472 RepID=A0A672IYR7_SALFA